MKKRSTKKKPVWTSLVKVTHAGLTKPEAEFLETQVAGVVRRIAGARAKWNRYRKGASDEE